MKTAPELRWLRLTVLGLGAAVFALLLADVTRWRPGFAVGDEALQFRLLLRYHEGGELFVRLLQGSLQRGVLQLWLEMAPFRLAWLHWPGLLAFALELGLLWRLARRWEGERVAWGAVAFALLSATAWIRARSLLSFLWVPLFQLLLAHASTRVRRPAQALALGLGASLLLLDYEAGVLALPFVALACAEREAGFRAQWRWALSGFAAGAALLAAWQWPVLKAYAALRVAVNAGEFKGGLFAAWLSNLSGLFRGAHPLAYFGVDSWPALPLWAWAPLGLGLLAAARAKRWALLCWPLAVIAVSQLSLAPWGISPHRLCAVWVGLALWAGLGLQRLLDLGGAKAGWVLLLLPLGFGLELHAWARHMAVHGAAHYGRASRMEEACDDLRRISAQEGVPVLSGLMELRYPEIRWFLGPQPAPEPGAREAIVVLPLEYRVPAQTLGGRTMLWHRSRQEQPVLALRVQGAQARRFLRMDDHLRPLRHELPVEAGSLKDRAWLQAPGRDPWAREAVLERDLARLWFGGRLDEDLMKAFAAQAPVQPGPSTLLAKHIIKHDPARALALLDRALAIDPDYSPALEARGKAWDVLGDTVRGEAARVEWRDRVAAGAWQVYE